MRGGAYAKHPRGHKASKTDLRREASAIALGNTCKSVFVDKEEASAKRDEERRRDKEEHIQSFAGIQSRTLEIQQRKLDLAEVKERARSKELELKAKEYEATLLAEESKIMMADLSALDPARRAWFESKQAMICARDA
jgi:arginine utilization protein RocB